jgi:hypothetical protein
VASRSAASAGILANSVTNRVAAIEKGRHRRPVQYDSYGEIALFVSELPQGLANEQNGSADRRIALVA